MLIPNVTSTSLSPVSVKAGGTHVRFLNSYRSNNADGNGYWWETDHFDEVRILSMVYDSIAFLGGKDNAKEGVADESAPTVENYLHEARLVGNAPSGTSYTDSRGSKVTNLGVCVVR